MFLDWIAQLKLLQQDQQTNILSILPLAKKKILISEITTYLYPPNGQPPPDPALFNSTAHVKWFTEVVGQGFALPLEDMNITADDINIYAQWLFEEKTRPIAVRAEGLDQEFMQTIFHHYSLLFQSRFPRIPLSSTSRFEGNRLTSSRLEGANNIPPPPPPPEVLAKLVRRHIELCDKVITIFVTAGRTLGTSFSNQTWTVLLKVFLGVTDFLLQEPMGDLGRAGMMNMGDALCEHLMRALFELWLRSRTRDTEMWNMLMKCFVRWTHRPQTINQWSATSLGLTQRVIRLLYGPTEGTDVTMINVNGLSINLELPAEFVFYAWHRIIYLIKSPWQLPTGSNFTLAVAGIGRLVDAFHQVGSPGSPPEVLTQNRKVPDGNTILHMFGAWLFEACSLPRNDVESYDGRADAYGILCRIFSKPQCRVPFLRTYTERFYAVLSIGLRSEICLPSILLNSTSLFAADLEGIRMMLPEFVVGIKMVLPKPTSRFRSRISIEELRLAAIKVASTIMCLPNHFEKVLLEKGWDTALKPGFGQDKIGAGDAEVLVTQLVGRRIRVLYTDDGPNSANWDSKPFTALKYYVLELLLMSLRTENSSYNLRYLLHLLNVYVVEDVPFCPGLVGTVVKLIQEKILTMELPLDVTLTAFNVLIDFVGLYDYVKRDSKNCARELVLALCRYVDTLMANLSNIAETHPLIIQAYDLIVRWILVGQWIVGDRDCYQAVIATLSRGICILEREIDSTGQADDKIEKKKRREGTFQPTKQFFGNLPKTLKGEKIGEQANQNGNLNRSNPAFHKKEEAAVKAAAEYSMSQFVNHLANFPPWRDQIGPSRMSTLWDDLKILAKWLHIAKNTEDAGEIMETGPGRNNNEVDFEEVSNIRHFLLDGRILISVVEANEDKESNPSVPSVIVILRDTTGKYSWTMGMQYLEDSALKNRDSFSSLSSKSHTTSVIDEPTLVITTSKSSQPSQLVDTDKSPLAPFDDRDILSSENETRIRAANEDEIPSLDAMFPKNSDIWTSWNVVRQLTDQQIRREKTFLKSRSSEIKKESGEILHDSHVSGISQGFRLLLSQMGFLSLEYRDRVLPLQITNALVSELQTLDMLSERECMSISVHYSRSGNTEYMDLVTPPQGVTDDFIKFVHSLGWPVDLSRHQGYKGKLDSAICRTAPYYADRNVEVIFNVPVLCRIIPPPKSSLHGRTPSDPGSPQSPDFKADYLSWATTPTVNKVFAKVSKDDHVIVVWIDDLVGFEKIVPKIREGTGSGSKGMVYIFVNPLVGGGDGLYWVRILVPLDGGKGSSKLSENSLAFGPLVDGMIISRHALGLMVRNTAISAHQACKVAADTYTRPYVVRKQFIDEMTHRYRSRLPVSEFYGDMFSGR